MLNLVLYGWGLRDRPAQLAALLRLAPFFLVAPALVLAGGFVDGLPLRSALWVASLTVDLAGVLATGRENDCASPPPTSPSGTG